MVKWVIWLFVCISVSESPAQSVLKEFRSHQGVVRLFLTPQNPDDSTGPDEPLYGDGDTGSVTASIRDLTLPGGTLLMVSFQEAYSGEEIRFPVRVSQINRFLRLQSKRNRSGSRDDRLVAGIRDLSVTLKVRMKKPREAENSK